MGLMGSIKRRLGIQSPAFGQKMTSQELFGLMSGSSFARSGASVNWMSALCVTAVLSCVRVIAEDIAKVPIKLFRGDGRTNVAAKDHALYNIIGRRPNGWQTSFEFREMLMASAVLCGNGYAYIVRGLEGRVLELLPLPPQNVTVRRPTGTWDLIYTVTLPNGGGVMHVLPKNMLHLRGITLDGIVGADIVRHAREAIGLAMATEEQQAKFARGGLKSAGVLQTPANLTEEQVRGISKLWVQEWGGAANADKTPILYGGLEFKALMTSGKDAEILGTREHQIVEIARAFRVFPQMIGYTDKTATHGSADSFFIAHVIHTLQPWCARFEQVMERDLLTQDELDQGYYFKFMLQGLLRGDNAARAAFYHEGITDGWMTRNDARVCEDMNPMDGLDVPILPLNMKPISGDDANDPDDDGDNDTTDPNDTQDPSAGDKHDVQQ